MAKHNKDIEPSDVEPSEDEDDRDKVDEAIYRLEQDLRVCPIENRGLEREVKNLKQNPPSKNHEVTKAKEAELVQTIQNLTLKDSKEEKTKYDILESFNSKVKEAEEIQFEKMEVE